MNLIADISEGNSSTADVFFLIAVILAVLSALAHYSAPAARHAGALLSAAVASAALAWLVL
jgi:hypothetical protein